MTKELYQNSKAWPFEEARKILTKIGGKTPKKGYVLFETGYGPSGLPHIGTFGEVVRTCFVRHAFNCLAPEIPTRLFCVSDDIDGLRKVPENVPNQEMVKANLGKPLTAVPDPFATHQSYGHHMNARLRSFLDHFGFDYEFISATEKYQSGEYDETMLKVLDKYEEIMALMLPTLGAERQATYSPFMPICPETGKVLDKSVIGVSKENKTVIYLDSKGQKQEIAVTGGNCKLQWKVDFGARWYTLDVDYEIYGKEHFPNEGIYQNICKILGGRPPVNYFYELFLSEDGAKISKSLGNGIAVEDWLKYAPQESISLFMYQKPKTAKRLYFDVIPKAMDEYLAFLAAYQNEELVKKVENPVFHIHFGKVPELNFNLNYSLILNLASACNPDNEGILWGFISKYSPDINPKTAPLLDKMVKSALNYYNDFIKQHKKYRKATKEEELALNNLKAAVIDAGKQNITDPQLLQNMVFEVGRNHGYEKNMRDWFIALYQILLGQNEGPRMGSFIALFGHQNFVKLIEDKLLI